MLWYVSGIEPFCRFVASSVLPVLVSQHSMSQHAVDRVLERRAERADALLRVLAEVATESPASESSAASSNNPGFVEFGNNPQFWRLLSEFITGTDEAIISLQNRVTHLEAIVSCDTASQRDEVQSDVHLSE